MSNARTTQPLGALIRPGHARMTVVSGPCPEGLTFGLSGSAHVIGRAQGDVLLTEDTEVSPRHATVTMEGGRPVIADQGSVNGVYVRLRVPYELQDGTWFRTGEQVFRLFRLRTEEAFRGPDGTMVFTSPRRKGTFRVQQVLRDGLPGMSSSASNDELSIGGAGAAVAFSTDPFLSTTHAKVYKAPNGAIMLEDSGSTNGTWVRLSGPMALSHGDYFLVGATVFRVDLT